VTGIAVPLTNDALLLCCRASVAADDLAGSWVTGSRIVADAFRSRAVDRVLTLQGLSVTRIEGAVIFVVAMRIEVAANTATVVENLLDLKFQCNLFR